MRTLLEDCYQYTLPDLDEIYHLYPFAEKDKHNFTEPNKCRCYPDADVLLLEDGTVYAVIVNHKWEQ